jgi:RHS repeat-associated protein
MSFSLFGRVRPVFASLALLALAAAPAGAGAPPGDAPAGVTALKGRILTTSGEPLSGVVVRDHGVRSVSGADGSFVLSGLPSGHSVLVIDGRASGPDEAADYGYYEVGVEAAPGVTTTLPFVSYLPKIDHEHEVAIASPLAQEVVVGTPAFPGLEVHIPKGAILTDPEGQPVTRVGITPIPIDRTPFPIPPDHKLPVYFTIQPGGATIIGADGAWLGAQIWYPNSTHQMPGARVAFSRYDPDRGGWGHYGEGTVTADGSQVQPDPGTRIYDFTAASLPFQQAAALFGLVPPCNCDEGGTPSQGNQNSDSSAADPVDLATGAWHEKWTDLSIRDVIPIDLGRVYQSGDFNTRLFGVGMDFDWNLYLTGSESTAVPVTLVLPFSARVSYTCTIGCGTVGLTGEGITGGWTYQALSQPGYFYKSSLLLLPNPASVFSPGVTVYQLTTQDGRIYQFGQESGALQSVQDRFGNRVTLQQGAGLVNHLSSISSPSGRTITFTYDPSNTVITQARDNLGRTVTYSYDSRNRLIQVTDADGGVTKYTWNANNQIETVTNQNNNLVVTNTYYSSSNALLNNRVQQQQRTNGETTSFVYTPDPTNSFNAETDVTDPNGNLRKVTFNPAGYILTDDRAVGSAVEQDRSYTRSTGQAGQPPINFIMSTTDPLGRVDSFTYDANGNITTATFPSGAGTASVSAAYGAFNQLAQYTDPIGATTIFGLNGLGLPVTITDPDNNTTSLTFNPDGQIASVADATPSRNTTSFGYDVEDLASVTDPLGREWTRYTDAIGRTLTQSDPLGNLTQLAYDPLYGVTSSTDPSGAVTQIAYTPTGNILSVTDARQGKTSYLYDSEDRFSGRVDPLGATQTIPATGGYDANGNLLSVIDRKGQTATYTYDALNRISTASYADGSVVSYTWDQADRLTRIQDSVAGTITRSYDNQDRLVSETTPQGAVAYSYDAAGHRTGMTVPGQSPVAYFYDAAGNLTQISQGSATVTIGYDADNRRTSLTLPNGIVASYAYDAASQLTGITYAFNGSALGGLGYGYDLAGNQISRGGALFQSVLPSPVTSGSYDAANRLDQWTTPGGGVSPSYDANGNLLNDGTRAYTWDARNRLTGITGVASFTYDGIGRRQSTTINGRTVAYLNDGSDPVQEQSGGAALANILTGLGIDERFTRTEGATASTYLTDALGSSVALADGTGTISTSYGYDPYGNTSATGSANDNSYQYAGRPNDGTGLYYNRARYYNPAWGRFIAEDPLGLNAGINEYAYALGNPISFNDPFGLQANPGGPFPPWSCVGCHWGGTPPMPPEPMPVPIPLPHSVPAPSSSSSLDECRASCDAGFDAENELCRMLSSQQSRRQCFQQAQSNLAACYKDCKKNCS